MGIAGENKILHEGPNSIYDDRDAWSRQPNLRPRLTSDLLIHMHRSLSFGLSEG